MTAPPAPSEPPIAGATTLTLGDSIAMLNARMPLLAPRLAAIWFVGTAIVVGVEAYDGAARAPSAGALVAELVPFAAAAAGVCAILLGLGVALGYGLQALAFRRLPPENRELRYVADAAGLDTTDAAGAQLRIPWTMARRVWTTRSLLIMHLRAGPIRYAPLRAFAQADRPRLLAIARAGAAR